MAKVTGFWSYVHKDDQAEGGRIAQLARDIVAQYEMLTGDEIELFLDKDDLEWGARWRERVDDQLESVAFFVPVITPRFFQSAECRRELQSFADQAATRGRRDLILPLVYVDFPVLHQDPPGDPLIALVRQFQWQQWSELRFSQRDSSEYRKAVSHLAQTLADTNERLERTGTPMLAEVDPAETSTDDEPGWLDQVAEGEEALPKWLQTVEALTQQIGVVGELTHAAGEELQQQDAQGHSARKRLVVAIRLARQLADPCEKILSLSRDFTSGLHSFDRTVRIILQRVPEAAETAEGREQVCTYFRAVRGLVASTRSSAESMEALATNLSPIESVSRDLRAPLRTLRQGLTALIESRTIADEWLRLIESSPVKCDDDVLVER